MVPAKVRETHCSVQDSLLLDCVGALFNTEPHPGVSDIPECLS